MPTKLTPPLDAYFAAKNVNDIDAMLETFAEDAVVKDEGGVMRGDAAIRDWMKETMKKYQYTVEVLDAKEDAAKTTVACRLTGSFPGSPVEVSYVFSMKSGKIAGLEIN